MAHKRVLVTGAGGFIGRASLPALAARGYEIHAARGVDLRDPGAAVALLNAVAPTHLLHFAWVTTPGLYWTSPENRTWLEAGRALLRGFAAGGGRRAVCAGSCAEYDWSRAGVCRESDSPLADAGVADPTPYAACKIALQRELQAHCAAGSLSGAWGRIFFQYGPHEHPGRLVPTVIRSLLAGREAACSAGSQVRSFLHVDDVGDAFAALLDSDLQGPVNIGSAERVSVADLAGRIAVQLGRPELLRLGAKPTPPGEPALLVPDVARLHGELGWRARYDLDAGLAATIGWWREVEA
jgi:nucleoside-diphosphate-sugar epimerase